MVSLSFSNLFGQHVAGITVIIGVIFFFYNRKNKKESLADNVLDVKMIRPTFKIKNIWFWIALPLIMDAVCIIISKLFLPGYLEHVLARTEIFVSFDKVVIMIFQLAVLALLEEIAWRAFFQKQLTKVFSIKNALLITSLLFSIAHISSGNTNIIMYDLFFIFINSILYGIIFYKSNNVWISAISHFIANLFSILVLVFL